MRRSLQLMLVAALATGVAGRAWADDDPKAVIEKGIKAFGGEKQFARFGATRYKATGTLEAGGSTLDVSMTAEIQTRPAGKIKLDMKLPINGKDVQIVEVFDGEKAWIKVNDTTMDIAGSQIDELREALHAAHLDSLVPLLKDKKYTLTSLGEVMVNDRPAVGIKVAAEGRKDNELYFDKESGLMVKHARMALDDTMKEVYQEEYIKEYQETDGPKMPKTLSIKRDGKKYLDLEMTDYEFPEKFDDDTFKKP